MFVSQHRQSKRTNEVEINKEVSFFIQKKKNKERKKKDKPEEMELCCRKVAVVRSYQGVANN